MYAIGGLIILGILAQWIAWRLKVPAILPLIITGMIIGPVYEYYTGHRLLSPRFDPDTGEGLFPGNLLYSFVSLAIGLILFEGGLTLKLSEIKGLARSIVRLTTLGAFTTTIVAGLAVHYIVGLDWQLSFLFSTLIVVTGPTVIAPIMRQINVKRQISTVLKWESIVIDPVGAFLAVLMYNFIVATYEPGKTINEAIFEFIRSGLVGIGLGFLLGMGLYFIIKRLYVPRYLLNVFTLASVIGAFVLSDMIAHESGLLTAVMMGATLANRDVPFLHDILDFKESLTLLLISMLFILLSANMSVEQIQLVISAEALAIFAIVVFVARPLGVFWSLAGSDLDWRDKAFISWVGPRGIVAAGVASLFGIELEESGVPGAEYITPLVFLVVLGTVLLNATLAGFISKRLRVNLPQGSGVMIFGASEAAQLLASCLVDSGRDVTLVSTNRLNLEMAREANLEVQELNIHSDSLDEKLDLTDVGYILAMTASEEDNLYILNRYQNREGLRGNYRLINRKEVQNQRYGDEALFSPYSTFLIINRLARQSGQISSVAITDATMLKETVSLIRTKKLVPLFVKCAVSSDISFVRAGEFTMEVNEGDTLFYLGNPIPAEEFPKDAPIEVLTLPEDSPDEQPGEIAPPA
ncbi:cell shape-determining protein [Lewinellaceae bacterium SD302]|nr:cell shape-determining protein [Lewinellaceae bacterium SD302]